METKNFYSSSLNISLKWMLWQYNQSGLTTPSPSYTYTIELLQYDVFKYLGT